VLASWERASQRFVKVMPRDYKRVIEERAAQESDDRLAASGERG
jgi:glutamate synthase domain-containing protein 3